MTEDVSGCSEAAVHNEVTVVAVFSTACDVTATAEGGP